MRKVLLIAAALSLLSIDARALDNVLFKAGAFRITPSGDLNLEPEYTVNFGAGTRLVEDLYLMLEFDYPVKLQGGEYPLIVDINGADSSLYYREFTVFHGMIAGHYTFRVFEDLKLLPKIYGGLGLFWLYNSKKSLLFPDIEFRGIGPEMGFGAIYEFTSSIWLDMTFSVKFAYYNEYKIESWGTTAVGLDEQYMCFNLALYYLLDLK